MLQCVNALSPGSERVHGIPGTAYTVTVSVTVTETVSGTMALLQLEHKCLLSTFTHLQELSAYSASCRCVDGEINCANVKVFLRKLRRQAATELQRTLLCSVKAHTSGKTPPVVVMEDTNSILQIARVMCPQEWCDHVERTNWLDVVCYWRGTALTGGGGRSPKLQPVQAEAMRIELEKLEQLVYPARSLSVARNDLVRDVTRHI